jgi:hypothetical protein
VLLSTVVRIGWLLLFRPVMEEEGVYYARMGDNLAKGRLFLSVDGRQTFTDQPLYTVLIASLDYLGVNSELSGRCISITLGTLLTIPMALIALQLYGRDAAYFVGGSAALHPFLIGISTSVLSEATFLLFAVSGIYYLFSSLTKNSYRPLALAGALFGIAYLTRVEGVILPFAAIIVLSIPSRYPPKQRLYQSLAVLVPFAVLFIPYVVFLNYHTGMVSFEAKSSENYVLQRRLTMGIPPEESLFKIGDTLEDQSIEAGLRSGTIKVALRGKMAFAIGSGIRTIRDLVDHVLTESSLGEPLLIVYVIMGVFGSAWSKDRLLMEGFLLLFVGMLFVAHGAGAVSFVSRHLACLLAVFLIWAGKGVQEVFRWAKGTFRDGEESEGVGRAWRVGSYVVMLGLMLGMALHSARSGVSYDLKGQVVDKQIGLFVKQTAPDLTFLMDTNPIAAFYSGKTLISFPYCDSGVALKYIEKKSVGILILRQNNASRPYLRDWIAHGIPDQRAELINSWSDEHGGAIKVYRWHSGTASSSL